MQKIKIYQEIEIEELEFFDVEGYGFFSGVKKMGSALASGAKKVGSAIKSGAKKTVKAVKSGASKVTKVVKSTASNTAKTVVSGVKKVGEVTGNLVTGAVSGAKKVGSTVGQAVESGVEVLTKPFSKKNTDATVSQNQNSDIPDIPEPEGLFEDATLSSEEAKAISKHEMTTSEPYLNLRDDLKVAPADDLLEPVNLEAINTKVEFPSEFTDLNISSNSISKPIDDKVEFISEAGSVVGMIKDYSIEGLKKLGELFGINVSKSKEFGPVDAGPVKFTYKTSVVAQLNKASEDEIVTGSASIDNGSFTSGINIGSDGETATLNREGVTYSKTITIGDVELTVIGAPGKVQLDAKSDGIIHTAIIESDDWDREKMAQYGVATLATVATLAALRDPNVAVQAGAAAASLVIASKTKENIPKQIKLNSDMSKQTRQISEYEVDFKSDNSSISKPVTVNTRNKSHALSRSGHPYSTRRPVTTAGW